MAAQSLIIVLSVLTMIDQITAVDITIHTSEYKNLLATEEKPLLDSSLPVDAFSDYPDDSGANENKNNQKREIRALFDLIMGVLNTVQTSAKHEVSRAKTKEIRKRTALVRDYGMGRGLLLPRL